MSQDASGPRGNAPKLQPVPAVAGSEPYRVPRHPAPIDLHLDGNEGLPSPPELLASLAGADPELVRRYPGHKGDLEARLAREHGVLPEQVLITAGIDDALDRTCRALLAPGRSLVLPVPTFEMMPRYAALAGAEVREVPWPGGPYPVEAVLAAAGPTTTVVAVVTPNNPTGAVATASDLERLAAGLPGSVLLLDLAYGEFADVNLTQVGLTLPRTLVFRTFSKAWGLAGLRVGYVMGPTEIVGWLRAAGSPYPVSGLSLVLASKRLESAAAEVAGFVGRVRSERGELADTLDRLGAEPLASQANFVLARVRDPLWLRDGMASLGIGVRIFPRHPQLGDTVRITCPGAPGAFARLLGALATVLSPELLLDPGSGGPGEPAATAGGLRAWTVVRTLEEARAARGRGSVSLAVASSEAAAGPTADELLGAGVARVLGSRAEIDVLLARTRGARSSQPGEPA